MSWLYHYERPPSIAFRAKGLDEAEQISRKLDKAIREVLGEKAAGYVTLGHPGSHPSNFTKEAK